MMKKYNIKGATDITGFGLAGHALKMAKASNVFISLYLSKLPLLNGAYRLAAEGCIPGAAFRNLEFIENDTLSGTDLDYNLKMIAFDAQTSGGVLISSPPAITDSLLTHLISAGLTNSAIIGVATERIDYYLSLQNQD